MNTKTNSEQDKAVSKLESIGFRIVNKDNVSVDGKTQLVVVMKGVPKNYDSSITTAVLANGSVYCPMINYASKYMTADEFSTKMENFDAYNDLSDKFALKTIMNMVNNR